MKSLSPRQVRLFGVLALLLICATALAASARALGSGDDEIVSEFKKYFRTYKDAPTRVEAVLSLDGHESPETVEALVPVLKMAEPDVVRASVRVLSKFKTQPPIQAIFAEIQKNTDEAVRSGLLQAIAEGKYGGATVALTALLTDKSWEVRRRAVMALTATNDTTAAPAIVPLIGDAEPAVRCAALEGLASMHTQLVVAPAIKALTDPVWQVRTSAILALKKVRAQESIEPLIARLSAEEGRLQVDVGDALNEITGRSFGVRLDLWKNFWDSAKEHFKIPTDAELAALRAKQKEDAAKYKAAVKETAYHGIETPSRSILFIIDVSGSMENMVVDKERFQDGGYPSLMRIDICKTELARTIQSLEDYVDFNIIAFATEVDPWKKQLVRANVLNKSSAADWVRKLQAIGGASKEDLAQAGLTASANLDKGKTNTYDALMTALNAAGRGTKDKNYEIAVDTIFFLSDGRPTVGAYVDPDDVLREVRAANQLRKVVIHTIAIGEFQKDFMKSLAEQNGGVFVDLGR